MNRRTLLTNVLGVAGVGTAGCLGAATPDLRVRNLSTRRRTIAVRVERDGTQVFGREFRVGAKSHEGATANDVYPGAGTYRVTASVDGGATSTSKLELREGHPVTHVTLEADGTLRIGKLTP